MKRKQVRINNNLQQKSAYNEFFGQKDIGGYVLLAVSVLLLFCCCAFCAVFTWNIYIYIKDKLDSSKLID